MAVKLDPTLTDMIVSGAARKRGSGEASFALSPLEVGRELGDFKQSGNFVTRSILDGDSIIEEIKDKQTGKPDPASAQTVLQKQLGLYQELTQEQTPRDIWQGLLGSMNVVQRTLFRTRASMTPGYKQAYIRNHQRRQAQQAAQVMDSMTKLNSMLENDPDYKDAIAIRKAIREEEAKAAGYHAQQELIPGMVTAWERRYFSDNQRLPSPLETTNERRRLQGLDAITKPTWDESFKKISGFVAAGTPLDVIAQMIRPDSENPTEAADADIVARMQEAGWTQGESLEDSKKRGDFFGGTNGIFKSTQPFNEIVEAYGITNPKQLEQAKLIYDEFNQEYAKKEGEKDEKALKGEYKDWYRVKTAMMVRHFGKESIRYEDYADKGEDYLPPLWMMTQGASIDYQDANRWLWNQLRLTLMSSKMKPAEKEMYVAETERVVGPRLGKTGWATDAPEQSDEEKRMSGLKQATGDTLNRANRQGAQR